MILGIICERLGPSPLHNACDSAANHPTVVSHGHRPEKLRNDVWTTHLLVCMSVSGPVSIVVGPINDDPKHQFGHLLTWEVRWSPNSYGFKHDNRLGGGSTVRRCLRNDVWITHLLVCMSVSGPVSTVVGPINDDPKHHVGQLLTWEHPAFKFASNRIRFVTRTTLHNSPSQHKQCVADRPQNVVG